MKIRLHKPKSLIAIRFFLLIAFVSMFSSLVLTVQPVYAAPCSEVRGATRTLPSGVFVPWYKYLDCNQNGTLSNQNSDLVKTVSLVGMAIIELLTRIAGLVAVGFLVWGGIQYTTSQGEPEGINNAKSTILNAIVGLVISLIAIGLVQFVAGLIQ